MRQHDGEKDVVVPNGLGMLNRTARIRVDEGFGRFLEEEIARLQALDLDDEVLDHVLKHELGAAPDGLIAEFGIFRGESINRIAERVSPSTVYGFDSFEGLPEDYIKELPKGTFSLAGRLPEVRPEVRLVKGWFHEALPPFLKKHSHARFRLIHFDCDLYSSAKIVLNLCRDRISSGTILVFDEIVQYAPNYLGEMRALYEFLRESGRRFEWIGYGFDVGCALRLPGWRGQWIGWRIRAASVLLRRPPRLKVAAAVRIL